MTRRRELYQAARQLSDVAPDLVRTGGLDLLEVGDGAAEQLWLENSPVHAEFTVWMAAHQAEWEANDRRFWAGVARSWELHEQLTRELAVLAGGR